MRPRRCWRWWWEPAERQAESVVCTHLVGQVINAAIIVIIIIPLPHINEHLLLLVCHCRLYLGSISVDVASFASSTQPGTTLGVMNFAVLADCRPRASIIGPLVSRAAIVMPLIIASIDVDANRTGAPERAPFCCCGALTDVLASNRLG